MIKRLICLCLSFTLMCGNGFAEVFNSSSNVSDMASILETKGYIPAEGFLHYIPEERIFFPWTMHIYADNLDDLKNLSNKILPYLQYMDVEHKISFNAVSATDDIQAHKAITIYPPSKEDFKRIAIDLEAIIGDNKLQTAETNIYGDTPLGESGRMFYRYTAGSKYYLGKDMYRINDGHYYLPEGMTIYDDPFHNFNPSRDLINQIEIETMEDLENINYILHGHNTITLGRDFEGFNNNSFVSRKQLLFTKNNGQIRVENIGKNSVFVNGQKLPGSLSLDNSAKMIALNNLDKELTITFPSKNSPIKITVNLQKYTLKNMTPNKITAIRTNGQIIKNFFKSCTFHGKTLYPP